VLLDVNEQNNEQQSEPTPDTLESASADERPVTTEVCNVGLTDLKIFQFKYPLSVI
jgi:hypothetical protein